MVSQAEIEEAERRQIRDTQIADDIAEENASKNFFEEFFKLLFDAFSSFLSDLSKEEDPYLNVETEDRNEVDRRAAEDQQRYGDQRARVIERFTPSQITADTAELYSMRQEYERRYGGRVEAVSPVRDGEVNSLRGMRFHPIHREDRMHEGVDMVGDPDIRAAMPGIVVYTGWRGGYGNTIEIMDIYGVRHRYAHLADIEVAVGNRIEINQEIGTMGMTGGATGVHLHYEQIDANGRRRDPIVQAESINRRGALPETHQHAHDEHSESEEREVLVVPPRTPGVPNQLARG
ncbi:MAG: M23 family metallopeptidase [Rickettsiales bacterium]